jgi:hypothetical protein
MFVIDMKVLRPADGHFVAVVGVADDGFVRPNRVGDEV